MFNLIEIWKYNSKTMKLIFWLIELIYASLIVFMLGLILYLKGIDHLIVMVNDGRMKDILCLYLIWPTAPMLLLRWFEGYAYMKKDKENHENVEA